jgi:hypothetical protein
MGAVFTIPDRGEKIPPAIDNSLVYHAPVKQVFCIIFNGDSFDFLRA